MSPDFYSLRVMRAELEKRADLAEDMPWYTTAAGVTGGTLLGAKILPPKYHALGQIGGALLGTAAGLKAGNYLGKKMKKPQVGPEKVAAAEEKPDHPAKTLAKGVLGLGAGMGGGYLGMKGLQHLTGGSSSPIKGSKLMWAVPAITGAGGLIYSQMQGQMLDKMRRDHLKRQEMKKEGVSFKWLQKNIEGAKASSSRLREFAKRQGAKAGKLEEKLMEGPLDLDWARAGGTAHNTQTAKRALRRRNAQMLAEHRLKPRLVGD